MLGAIRAILNLRSRDALVRAGAVERLASRRTSRATARILDLLRNDPANAVRCAAANALATRSDDESIDALLHAIHVDTIEVRRAAASALSTRAIPAERDPEYALALAIAKQDWITASSQPERAFEWIAPEFQDVSFRLEQSAHQRPNRIADFDTIKRNRNALGRRRLELAIGHAHLRIEPADDLVLVMLRESDKHAFEALARVPEDQAILLLSRALLTHRNPYNAAQGFLAAGPPRIGPLLACLPKLRSDQQIRVAEALYEHQHFEEALAIINRLISEPDFWGAAIRLLLQIENCAAGRIPACIGTTGHPDQQRMLASQLRLWSDRGLSRYIRSRTALPNTEPERALKFLAIGDVDGIFTIPGDLHEFVIRWFESGIETFDFDMAAAAALARFGRHDFLHILRDALEKTRREEVRQINEADYMGKDWVLSNLAEVIQRLEGVAEQFGRAAG